MDLLGTSPVIPATLLYKKLFPEIRPEMTLHLTDVDDYWRIKIVSHQMMAIVIGVHKVYPHFLYTQPSGSVTQTPYLLAVSDRDTAFFTLRNWPKPIRHVSDLGTAFPKRVVYYRQNAGPSTLLVCRGEIERAPKGKAPLRIVINDVACRGSRVPILTSGDIVITPLKYILLQ